MGSNELQWPGAPGSLPAPPPGEPSAPSPHTGSITQHCTAHLADRAMGGGGLWQALPRKLLHPSIAKTAVAPPLWPHGPEGATADVAARQRPPHVLAQGSQTQTQTPHLRITSLIGRGPFFGSKNKNLLVWTISSQKKVFPGAHWFVWADWDEQFMRFFATLVTLW